VLSAKVVGCGTFAHSVAIVAADETIRPSSSSLVRSIWLGGAWPSISVLKRGDRSFWLGEGLTAHLRAQTVCCAKTARGEGRSGRGRL